jgi:hypothetical protein
MITESDIDDAKDAIYAMGEAYCTLCNVVRSLPEKQRRLFFNPETFGPIDAFLGQGSGFQAAYRGSEFNDSDDLIAILEENLVANEED